MPRRTAARPRRGAIGRLAVSILALVGLAIAGAALASVGASTYRAATETQVDETLVEDTRWLVMQIESMRSGAPVVSSAPSAWRRASLAVSTPWGTVSVPVDDGTSVEVDVTADDQYVLRAWNARSRSYRTREAAVVFDSGLSDVNAPPIRP